MSDDSMFAAVPVRVGHVFSKLRVLERLYTAGAFVVAAFEMVRGSRGMDQFLALWIGLAMLSLFASFWPRTPRVWSLLAEAFLTLLTLGDWVARTPGLFPWLDRFSIMRDLASPEERRLIAWNVLGGLGLFWIALPFIAATHARLRLRTRRGIGWVLGFVSVWILLLALFVMIGLATLNS